MTVVAAVAGAAHPEIAAPGQAKRVPQLDGLRGVAIALVLAHHFLTRVFDAEPGTPMAYAQHAASLGYLGVDLFFALSGYLIGGIIFDHAASPRFVSAFYIRRAARILPTAFVFIVIILLANHDGLLASDQHGGAPWTPLTYFFFATNLCMAAAGSWGFWPLAHLWSLAIEEQFYLVAPWVLRATSAARLPLLLGALVLFAAIFRPAALALGLNSIAVAFLPISRLDGLGVGLLAAWAMRHRGVCAWLSERARLLPALIGTIVVVLALITRRHAMSTDQAMLCGGYTLAALASGAAILYLELRPQSFAARAFSLRPLVTLGRYSYFLYLFQELVINLVAGFMQTGTWQVMRVQSGVQLAVGFVVLLVIAAASWRWFETPVLKLGRRWRYAP